jgi:hypothetical protein
MLSISSLDTSRFPTYEELSGAVIPPPVGASESAFVVEARANILHRAERLFGFQPGGGDMWDTPLLDIIDAQFREHMQLAEDDERRLRSGFGSMHESQRNNWRQYREGVLKEVGKYVRDQYDAAKASTFLSRLLWFMRDESCDSHRFLPLPTVSCLRAVGERLLNSELALTEVSILFTKLCGACRSTATTALVVHRSIAKMAHVAHCSIPKMAHVAHRSCADCWSQLRRQH